MSSSSEGSASWTRKRRPRTLALAGAVYISDWCAPANAGRHRADEQSSGYYNIVSGKGTLCRLVNLTIDATCGYVLLRVAVGVCVSAFREYKMERAHLFLQA